MQKGDIELFDLKSIILERETYKINLKAVLDQMEKRFGLLKLKTSLMHPIRILLDNFFIHLIEEELDSYVLNDLMIDNSFNFQVYLDTKKIIHLVISKKFKCERKIYDYKTKFCQIIEEFHSFSEEKQKTIRKTLIKNSKELYSDKTSNNILRTYVNIIRVLNRKEEVSIYTKSNKLIFDFPLIK